MKIALFSDIHANLPALEAFFKSIDDTKPDAIYCLGDLVGYNVWPNEVVNAIRDRGIATIAGNHDLKVNKNYLEDGTKLEDLGKNYAYAIIGEDEKKYLKTLPAHLRVIFQLGNELLTLLLVHGSPESVNEYLTEDLEIVKIAKTLADANADILCFGHTHKPYHRILTVQAHDRTTYKHAINIGSIGKPKDGDPRGCYILLTLHENSSILEKSSISVDFVRFNYDVEKAALAVKNSPLPDEFADNLRQAK